MKLNTILNSDTSGSADVAFSDEALKMNCRIKSTGVVKRTG